MTLLHGSRIIAACLCLTLFLGLAAQADARKPNVLFIAIDDLNDWVGCLGGHPQASTPNIDRLAKRGTLFINAHCQGPNCGPSRASLLSGGHGIRNRGSPDLGRPSPFAQTG